YKGGEQKTSVRGKVDTQRSQNEAGVVSLGSRLARHGSEARDEISNVQVFESLRKVKTLFLLFDFERSPRMGFQSLPI
ncbi:MAG: hypothetical protein ACREYF_13245, partial [Gammaproteobacteria bacterium]